MTENNMTLSPTMREALQVLAAAMEPLHERDVKNRAHRRVTTLTLDRLEKDGLVTSEARRNGRTWWFDFYYAITDAGRVALGEVARG